MQIARIYLPVPGLEVIRAEAAQQSFRFIARLISDWESGLNTFSQDGETLLGGYEGEQLIAVGGLNKDPYIEGTVVDRIRHVYVLAKWRRRGVGRALIDRLLVEAENVFSEVRLRTETAEAADFYIRCGFDRIEDETASHRWKMRDSR
jgi:GNAT superfamily N-acetyltransferase